MMKVKKLKAYIQDDRPQKLKRYVLSREIDVNDVQLGSGSGLLHYCAKNGSPHMLKCLLQLECDPCLTDKEGNLPLHVAAQRALTETSQEMEEVFTGIVQPLLSAYPMGLDIENKRLETGHDMVSALKKKIKQQQQHYPKFQASNERLDSDEEEKWRQKLAEEGLFDGGLDGRDVFDEDYAYQGTESFDAWSERMRHEHWKKSQTKNRNLPSSHRRKRKAWGSTDDAPHSSSGGEKRRRENPEEDEKLGRAREEMRKRYKPMERPDANLGSLLSKKARYEEKFSNVLHHLLPAGQPGLTFAKIPWPNSDIDRVVATLFCDLQDEKSEEYRVYLRTQRIRWHPDKFTQKFGDHLHPDHRQKILNRVKVISQMLNKLSSQS